MDTSHCGKLTNTPWRPSDEHARPHASLQFTCRPRTRTRKRALPTRDKHERIYGGSLPRERNEMKRLYHRAVLVQRSIPSALSLFPASNHCSILRSAHAGACVIQRCWTDEQMTINRMTRVFTRVRARNPVRR